MAIVFLASGVEARADGALAMSKSGRPHAAIVVNEDAGRAEADALKQCGNGCEVTQRFNAGCASYASGQYAMGWSAGATSEEASFAALQHCREYGSDCVTRITRCESREATSASAGAPQARQRLLLPSRGPAIDAGTSASQVASRAPGDDSWAVAGVRTGMSAAEARAALEREGLQVTSTSSYYQYNDPLSGESMPDRSVPMLAVLTGTSQNTVRSVPVETVKVLLTPAPGAERVYAVWEQMEYTRVEAQPMPLENLRQAATAKFGPAQIDAQTGPGSYVMYWPADKSLSRLKPWVREPDLGSVAYQCGSSIVGGGLSLANMGYSPLAGRIAPTVEVMRAHCNERFVVGEAYLAPTGSSATEIRNGVIGSRVELSVNPRAPVTQYGFWLYDGEVAQAGQDALRAAEAALIARAAKAQRDAGANVKPRL